MREHLRRRIAKGGTAPRSPGRVIVSITFDSPMFDRLRAMAVAGNVSFNEQVRTVLEWGLESAGPD